MPAAVLSEVGLPKWAYATAVVAFVAPGPNVVRHTPALPA